MDNQQQFPGLMSSLNNLPLHLLLEILQYLDPETKIRIQNNSTPSSNNSQIFRTLISMSLFAQKYLTCTDRSVYFSFYAEPAFMKYEHNLIGDICVRNAAKYFRIRESLERILRQIEQQLQCLESKQSFVQIIENCIRDPQIPLPKMRKQGIAIHCCSTLQFSLADLFFQNQNDTDDFVDDSVLDVEQLLQCMEPTMFQLLQERIKNKGKGKGKSIRSIIKQCYYHPELLNLQNYQDYIIKSLTPFNLYVYVHALLSGVAEMYHEYIVDQQKQFERFIEFLTRYSIYRSVVITFESSQISRILYKAVQKIVRKVEQLTTPKIEQEVIFQSTIELENKRSGEGSEGQQIILIQQISRMSSEVITYKSQKSQKSENSAQIEMNSRLYLAGGKIWTNQSRRVKQLNEEHSSPSKYSPSISQDTINCKSYIRILNRLCHGNMLQRIRNEIEEVAVSGCKKEGSPPPMRDEDIVNIFGDHVDEGEAVSPTLTANSLSVSHGTQSPSSPTSPYPSFNQMIRSLNNLESCSIYCNLLMTIENKVLMQPYRYEKCQTNVNNDGSSISPEKQKEMPQINLQTLSKIPSFRNKTRLMSKTSMLSKFTRISQQKAVSNIQDLFESEKGVQEQILMQYLAHLMDLSVNEMTVHWCGHSEQCLMGDYFHNFEEYMLKFNEGFMGYLVKIVEEAISKVEADQKKGKIGNLNSLYKGQNICKKVAKSVLQWHLEYLDVGFINKCTLRKLVQIANNILSRLCNRLEIPQQEDLNINLTISEIDKMIEHYNEKMWKIERNVKPEKLKIYEQRKSPRNIIQVARCQQQMEKQNENDKCLPKSKLQRKRRNSQQVLIIHNGMQ